tara:strand:+ start:2703 stop:3278 length:576 start_codon:yes stop_codon:yes gene_type:complete
MINNFVKLFFKSIVPLLMIIIFFSQPLKGKDLMIDDFQSRENTRWDFITDQVMGGVSTGKLLFKNQNEDGYLHLTGNVSTKNKGGFIQARTSLEKVLTNDIKGIKIRAKGNVTKYYLHLRTTGTILPWHYYQAEFNVQEDWSDISIPLINFKKSGGFLRNKIKPKSLKSIGIVAYGRDHIADLSVSLLSFY